MSVRRCSASLRRCRPLPKRCRKESVTDTEEASKGAGEPSGPVELPWKQAPPPAAAVAHQPQLHNNMALVSHQP